jgi:drug/metabolite transporter (DMT)-like permease
MSYVGVELLVGLTVAHAVMGWCLPLASSTDSAKPHHGFAVGAVLCVGASLVCALGCVLPRRYHVRSATTTSFCASATLAALLVAAKALAAGLLACP